MSNTYTTTGLVATTPRNLITNTKEKELKESTPSPASFMPVMKI